MKQRTFFLSLILTLLLIGCSTNENPLTQADIQATDTAINDGIVLNRTTILEALCTDTPERCLIEGSETADATVYEISDYACPHCVTFMQTEYPKIKEELIDTGKIQYITIPSHVINKNSQSSVNATLCANEQEAGSAYHEAIYNDSTPIHEIDNKVFMQLATDLALDTASFEQCIDDARYMGSSAENKESIQNAGISSTPTLIINGENIPASLSGIEQYLAQ